MPRFTSRFALLLALLAAASATRPVAAQFASVPRAPAATPYDVRFGRDTVLTPVEEAAVRAQARRDLRAWVDSAAQAMGIELDLPDSIPVPTDSAALDSLTGQVGPAGARLDSIRRDSVRRDSIRRDSIRRDSLLRRIPPNEPMTAARSGGASGAEGSMPRPPSSDPGIPRRPEVAPMKDSTHRSR